MSTFLVFSVLFGALLHASWNALIKWEPDKVVASGAIATGAGIAALPILFFVPLPLAPAWPLIVFSSIIHVLYFVLVGYALRHADLGVAYPLTRGSAPAFTAILAAVWLGENLALNGWLAVGAIAAGVVTLSADALLRGGLTKRAAILAFTNAAVVVAYTLVDGYGGRVAGNAVSYVTWMMAGTAALMAIIAVVFYRGVLRAQESGFWIRTMIGGGLALASYGIAIWVMTQAPIGLVAALRETSVLFAAILGAALFGESFGPKRWAALALIVLGIGLLRWPF
ncbi:MAG: EamA family transporter [Xanthobacteraceae bacterium]|nr:EamA family transporter [Xanthobacteraceae bacterium]QYK44463.1 MAG: EamA family transporter [Xanthobacteraceae bacterium]